jgi:hypothetical protein
MYPWAAPQLLLVQAWPAPQLPRQPLRLVLAWPPTSAPALLPQVPRLLLVLVPPMLPLVQLARQTKPAPAGPPRSAPPLLPQGPHLLSVLVPLALLMRPVLGLVLP